SCFNLQQGITDGFYYDDYEEKGSDLGHKIFYSAIFPDNIIFMAILTAMEKINLKSITIPFCLAFICMLHLNVLSAADKALESKLADQMNEITSLNSQLNPALEKLGIRLLERMIPGYSELYEMQAVMDYLDRMNADQPDLLGPSDRKRLSRYLNSISASISQFKAHLGEDNEYLKQANSSTSEMIEKILLKSGKEALEKKGPKGTMEVAYFALKAVGCTDKVYGVNVHTPDTRQGVLACAAVTSAILKKAGRLKNTLISCEGLRAHLTDRLHWNHVQLPQYKAGDVVFWGEGNDPDHVGIVVCKDVYGNWWTVDNSSTRRMVVWRPIHGNYGRVAICAERDPENR
ncbi:MAG: hypothetical protein PHW04_13010, partial [Candidatus Wallbacteria bacterium]|nr:hypothetical protein [Candidatus Wallbacteria bacterium]